MRGHYPRLEIHRFSRDRGLQLVEAGESGKVSKGWVGLAPCPFCGSHGFHLGYHLRSGRFNCWKCGGHSAWEFVGAVLRTRDGDKIKRDLATYAGEGEVERRQVEAQEARKLVVPPGLGPLGKRHRDYLEGRGFDPDVLEGEWDLQGTDHLCPDPRWALRVVSPIRDARGRTCAYVGRSVRREAKLRYYVTPKEESLVDPSLLIYGIEKVEGDAVVVVEGPTDAWRLGRGAVAVKGIGWKPQQVNQLRKFRRRFIMFDSVDKESGGPDRDAAKRAAKLARYLSVFPGETEVVDGFSSDPGDFSNEQARSVMRQLLGGRQ